MNGYETTPEFQSTPPRGWRRWWNGHKRRIRFYFNPLHHEGGDKKRLKERDSFLRFQSTPPRGWRHNGHHVFVDVRRFQSTPPRGWRPSRVNPPDCTIYFNPLHHEGGDPVYGPSPLIQRISIHSTTRVETGGNIRRKEGPGNFNPLHHEGGDWESNTFPALRQDFNPLHHEGGDGNSNQ